MILLLAISFASAQLGPEEKKVGANKVRCQIANMTGPIGVPYVVPDKSDNVSAWDTVERERDNLTACNDRADLTNLTPVITVSDGATVSPASGVVQDFTNPVIYTTTDSYGYSQTYTVTITSVSNSG